MSIAATMIELKRGSSELEPTHVGDERHRRAFDTAVMIEPRHPDKTKIVRVLQNHLQRVEKRAPTHGKPCALVFEPETMFIGLTTMPNKLGVATEPSREVASNTQDARRIPAGTLSRETTKVRREIFEIDPVLVEDVADLSGRLSIRKLRRRRSCAAGFVRGRIRRKRFGQC